MKALVLLALCCCVVGVVPAQEVPGWGAGEDAGAGYSRVSSGAMAGQVLDQTPPIYPPVAKAARVSGAVVLHALVGKTGRVERLTVLSGPQLLQAAAADAVRHWTYKPYLLNGEPVGVDTTIVVHFNLAAGPQPESGRPAGDAAGDRESEGHEPAKPTTPADHRVIRISGGVLQSLLEEKVDPIYPATEASGAVVMKVRVNTSGEVTEVSVISGPESLRAASVDAVSQWRYKPYLLNGEAVDVEALVTVMFSRNR